MTPRKELLTSIKTALKGISSLQYIDLQRGQYDNPESAVAGTYYTGCLLEISEIEYEDMTNQVKEGKVQIGIYLYTKEGWAHQFEGATDAEDGLAEIDLQDDVIVALEHLMGTSFKPLYLFNENALPNPHPGIMAYKLSFNSRIYNTLTRRYVIPN